MSCSITTLPQEIGQGKVDRALSRDVKLNAAVPPFLTSSSPRDESVRWRTRDCSIHPSVH
jgi:hypothetical protein